MSLIILSSDSGTPIVGPYGPTTAATLILELQPGAKVSFEFATDVMKTWSGREQRVGTIGAPKLKIDGVALLVDGDDRSVRAKLMKSAASGAAFLLGLPYEELTVSASSSGTTVNVYATTYADWTQPGQRVIVLDVDNTALEATVQSSTGTTVVVDPAVTVKRGARIMPAVAVYLEPTQGLGRHVVGVTELHLSAQSAEFGFAGVETMGVGVTLTQWTDPVDAYPYYVWSWRDLDDMAEDSLQSLAEIIDLGGKPLGVGSANEPDWGRQVQLSGDRVMWQSLKAFLWATRGRQVSWLLPTWRPDMVFVSAGVNTIKVASSTAGGGDLIGLLDASSTHYLVQLLYANGTVDYLHASAWADNLDGTITLNVDHSPSGSGVVLVSFLERVRWEADVHEPTWDGDAFAYRALARVVQ